ncbi:MAG: PEP-CTERM sorting domain-containing protein [Armatimonadetes bacterium]|nr:PEP-CTERM sorting domain-containing protein [Armatimonadota bacterium]
MQRMMIFAVLCLGLSLRAALPVFAQEPAFVFETELLSMNLSGEGLLPLGPNWGQVMSRIHLQESPNLASTGRASAYALGNNLYRVDSFFDVFFDLTLQDVDPTLDFSGQQAGASLILGGNGPARLFTSYIRQADPSLPQMNLFPPPEAFPYIGWFDFAIPLGADLNGNGETDVLKFTLASQTWQDANRTFITLPDSTVINTFDAAMEFTGAVMDASQDPPFGPIVLTGPTTASSRLEGPDQVVPEPASLFVLGSGLVSLAWRGRRRNLRLH